MIEKDLTQRRGGAEDAEFMSDSSLLIKIYYLKYKSSWKNDNPTNNNFASSAPLRLCEKNLGIILCKNLVVTES